MEFENLSAFPITTTAEHLQHFRYKVILCSIHIKLFDWNAHIC